MLVLGITDNIARSNYFFIAKTEATSSAVASLDFSNIPQDYTHLQIRLLTSNTVNNQQIYLRFNGDTGATQYSYYGTTSDGVSATAFSSTGASFISVGSTNIGATGVGQTIITISNYRNSNVFKSLNAYSGRSIDIRKVMGLWKSGTAISSLSLYPAANNFSQYSVAALYGIK